MFYRTTLIDPDNIVAGVLWSLLRRLFGGGKWRDERSGEKKRREEETYFKNGGKLCRPHNLFVHLHLHHNQSCRGAPYDEVRSGTIVAEEYYRE